MFMMVSVIGVLYLMPFLLCAAKFPNDIQRCTVGDFDCLIAESNRVLHTFSTGHAGLHLIKIDPLLISEITLKQGSESPVNIELNFKEIELIGMASQVIYSIKGFEQDPSGKYEFKLKGPVLALIGPYKVTGRVLILPVQGEGKSNMTLVSPDLHITFTGKMNNRNGKEYLHIDDLKLTFTIDRMYMQLDNLYNGDKALGDGTNLFINENWEVIFDELKQSIFDAFGLIIQNILNTIFRKIPYKELFMSN